MRAAAAASTPQVGWLTTSTPGSGQDLPADDELLQVAARERAGGGVGAGLAHVEGLDDRGRAAPRAAPRRSRPRRASARGGVARQHGVLRQAHLGRRRVAVALLRHEGRAAPAPRRDAEPPDGGAVDADQASGRAAAALAGEGGEELRLAVAGDAGDAQDLAAADREADVAQRRRRAGRGAGRDSPSRTRRSRPGAVPARPVTAPTCAPTIRAASERALSARGSQAPTTLPWRRMVARVAEPAHLVEPVRDVEQRPALVAQPLQRGEQPLGLLRRQHRGRLVEDDEARVLQQAAHDLDALALAGRERPDRPAGLELQAVGGADAPRSARRAPCRDRLLGITRAMFSATVRFSQSEKCWNTMPIPMRARRLGAGQPHDVAPVGDDALGRLQQPVEDLHQGRLAGAVLAEQRVDLAGADLEVDAVVGGEVAEALDDAVGPVERRGADAVGAGGCVFCAVCRCCVCRCRRGPVPVASTARPPSGVAEEAEGEPAVVLAELLRVHADGVAVDHPPRAPRPSPGRRGCAPQRTSAASGIVRAGEAQLVQGEQREVGLAARRDPADVVAAEAARPSPRSPSAGRRDGVTASAP